MMTVKESSIAGGKGIAAFVLSLFLFATGFAQTDSGAKLPKEIRGYKVHKAMVIVVENGNEVPQENIGKADSMVKIGAPQNFKISLAGATFELPMSMNNYKASGRIDLITFENMRANGIKMSIEDFTEPFDIRKGTLLDLPKPVKVSVTADGQDPLALMNFDTTLNDFDVTGRVYVFGTFRKFGMKFKRVVPVDFRFKTKVTLPLLSSN